MKKFLFLSLFCLFFLAAFTQQSLEFGQALIINNNTQTVPSGKVWKVTCIYGEEYRYNECVDMSPTSTHELSRMRCAYTSSTWVGAQVSYTIAQFSVNGTNIPCRIEGLTDQNIPFWQNTSCTGSNTTINRQYSCANLLSDPNIFPIWLPAGTTIASGGPNTFLSVLEFNVIP